MAGLTQFDVSRLAHVGSQTVSRAERGEVTPTRLTAGRIIAVVCPTSEAQQAAWEAWSAANTEATAVRRAKNSAGDLAATFATETEALTKALQPSIQAVTQGRRARGARPPKA